MVLNKIILYAYSPLLSNQKQGKYFLFNPSWPIYEFVISSQERTPRHSLINFWGLYFKALNWWRVGALNWRVGALRKMVPRQLIRLLKWVKVLFFFNDKESRKQSYKMNLVIQKDSSSLIFLDNKFPQFRTWQYTQFKVMHHQGN